MKKATRITVLMTLVAVITALPAQAKPKALSTTSSTVSVTLRISVGEPNVSPTVKSCAVSVNAGDDGVDVLQAAKIANCISSYSVKPSVWGNYVDCIDGICETPATYWRMTENGALTSYGVDAFSAAAGDVLGFSHTEWATCVVLGAC